MVRVLIVDDHPAVRAGIEAVIRIEPGLVPVDRCAGVEEAIELASRSAPDVAVVDYDLSDGNGLELCVEFQRRGIRSLVYSAYSEQALGPASLLAGAGGLLNKAAGGDELCEAVRHVARGIPNFPPMDPEVLEACERRIDPGDHAIFRMAVASRSRADVADQLGLAPPELDRRLEAMVERLRPATGVLGRIGAGAGASRAV